jgi:hypothetical protein
MHIDRVKWLLFARRIPSLSLLRMGDMQMQNRIIAGDSLTLLPTQKRIVYRD